jgi:CRISPR/Cas system CSM-associated protein Csm2 small subunit
MVEIDPVLIEVIYSILGIFGAVALGYFVNDIRYKKGKKILAELRKLVDHVDDSVYDDKISEEEFRQGWERLKGLFDAIVA